MKHWAELSADEKLDRLAEAVYNCVKRVDELMAHTGAGNIRGYNTVHVGMTLEGADHWLGVYPHTRKQKEAA